MENIAAKLQTPIADKRCSPKPCSLTLNREPKTQNPETRSQDVRELRRVALLLCSDPLRSEGSAELLGLQLELSVGSPVLLGLDASTMVL